MKTNLLPFAVLWALLAATVIALIIYRKMVAGQEDDALHVSQANVVSRQAEVAHKLDQIDRWGKILTVVTVVAGLALATAYVYQSWVQASNYLG